jgi:hypothetical protein
VEEELHRLALQVAHDGGSLWVRGQKESRKSWGEEAEEPRKARESMTVQRNLGERNEAEELRISRGRRLQRNLSTSASTGC